MRLLGLLMMLTLAAGCAKQPTVEERLLSVGTWTISELEWMKVTEAVTTDSSELTGLDIGVQNGSVLNAGTLVFSEGGTGTYRYELDNGMVRSGNMLWTTGEDGVTSIAEVSINFLDFLWNLINNPDGDFQFNQQLFAYDLTHNEGNDFTMQGGGTVQVIRVGSGVEVGQYVYTLEAKVEK